ncbi:MAG: hypothetical protein HY886_05105 [Deltaproteobacteria bacterium]|nr:hypothetical protein [Deltaproteobacteria bacterium]
MPPINDHLKTSMERTGKDYREVHEWIDADPAKKAERHEITKIYEYGKMMEERHGKEALEEYIRHIHDDIKAKFNHIQHDIEKAVTDTLSYFGVK